MLLTYHVMHRRMHTIGRCMTMPNVDDVKSLSDEELVEKAKLSGWRFSLYERSSSLGCVTALLLAALIILIDVFVVAMNFIGMCFLLFVAGLFGFLGVMSGLEYLSTIGKHRYINELRRRYGMLPLNEYVRGEKEESGILLSILAKGHGLPHGNHHFIRIRLWRNGKAEAESFVSKAQELRWIDGTHPRELVSRKQQHLDGEKARMIEGLAGNLAFGKSDSCNTVIRDGFPCRMSVIRHDSGQHYCLECNLAGLPKDAATTPAVKLLQELMGLEWKLNPIHEIIGSCDGKGDITIEERNP